MICVETDVHRFLGLVFFFFIFFLKELGLLSVGFPFDFDLGGWW